MQTLSKSVKLGAAFLIGGILFATLCSFGYLTQGEGFVARSFDAGIRVVLAGALLGSLLGLCVATQLISPPLFVAAVAALIPVAVAPLYVCDISILVIPLYSSLIGYEITQVVMYAIRRMRKDIKG